MHLRSQVGLHSERRSRGITCTFGVARTPVRALALLVPGSSRSRSSWAARGRRSCMAQQPPADSWRSLVRHISQSFDEARQMQAAQRGRSTGWAGMCDVAAMLQLSVAHLSSSCLCIAISLSVSLYAASCDIPCFMSSICRRAKRLAKGGSKLFILYGIRFRSGFRRYTSHISRSSGQIIRGFLCSYTPEPVVAGLPSCRARCL